MGPALRPGPCCTLFPMVCWGFAETEILFKNRSNHGDTGVASAALGDHHRHGDLRILRRGIGDKPTIVILPIRFGGTGFSGNPDGQGQQMPPLPYRRSAPPAASPGDGGIGAVQ